MLVVGITERAVPQQAGQGAFETGCLGGWVGKGMGRGEKAA